MIKSLLDSGIRLEQVRKVFSYMRNHLGEDVASANLVIDGSRSVLVNTGEELIDLLQNGQGVLNVLPLAGVKDEVDQCPAEAESKNGIDDEDGCPEPDGDGDGVLGSQDKCPREAEDKDGVEDDDGCPDLEPVPAADAGPDAISPSAAQPKPFSTNAEEKPPAATPAETLPPAPKISTP